MNRSQNHIYTNDPSNTRGAVGESIAFIDDGNGDVLPHHYPLPSTAVRNFQATLRRVVIPSVSSATPILPIKIGLVPRISDEPKIPFLFIQPYSPTDRDMIHRPDTTGPDAPERIHRVPISNSMYFYDRNHGCQPDCSPLPDCLVVRHQVGVRTLESV